jgi:membrane protein
VDDDIARHLGLNQQGSLIISRLFRSSAASFNFAIFLSLVFSLIGTLLVAKSVQTIYERAFDKPHERGLNNLLRCFVWVGSVAGLMFIEASIGKPLGGGSAGPLTLGLFDFLTLTLFFWWTIHFLLRGREPWRQIRPAAISTALFWLGLGVFASFYFSSTVISDNRLYGTIGVVFSLMTWFIAIGAVLALGAVVGAVWQNRRH